MSGRGKKSSEYNDGYESMGLDGGGGKREDGDRTHSLSRSYWVCTGSFACTN